MFQHCTTYKNSVTGYSLIDSILTNNIDKISDSICLGYFLIMCLSNIHLIFVNIKIRDDRDTNE